MKILGKFTKNIQVIDLTEARRNPDQNPKISAYEALLPYKNDPDIFISFTEVDKIGVNPKSPYNTPLGIYAYPLKEIWEEYDVEGAKSLSKVVPFAGDRKYIWVLRQKPRKVIQEVNDNRVFGKKDYEKCINLLYDYIDNDAKLSNSLTNREKQIDIWGKEAFVQSYGGMIWNITRNLASILGTSQITTSMKWNTLFRKVLNIDGIIDRSGAGVIHSSEPIQAVFFTTRAFKVEKELLNKDYFARIFPKWYVQADKDKELAIPGRDGETVRWKKGIWNDGTWENGTWEKGVWKNGTWYNGVMVNSLWEGGEWIKGVFEGGTWEKGRWITGYFNKSTWLKGDWVGGDFVNSTWKDGQWVTGKFVGSIWVKGYWGHGYLKFSTWKDGEWNKGTFYKSTWEKGTWYNGTWEKGTWEFGTWEDGTWKDGTWKDGTWKDGTWKDGTWRYGIWEDGTWEKGIWYNGTWYNGTWEDGTWEFGTWLNGTWKDGIWKDGTWKDGTWRYGIWEDGTWEKGLWKDGIWKFGTWEDGTWEGGTIHSDRFDIFLPSRVNPMEFYKIEKTCETIEDLEFKVK